MSLEEHLKITRELDESLIEELIDDEIDEVSSDIKSYNAIHDQFQFESKFDFDLSIDKDTEKKKYYYVDVYFFIPQTIGINTETYSREHFYADITNYLRIRTPDIFKWETDNISNWKLPWSEKYFKNHLSTRKRQKLISIVIYEVKLFGCFINTNLKKLQSMFVSIWNKERSQIYLSKKIKLLETRLQQVHTIVKRYREKYIDPIQQKSILMDDEVKKSFLISDEFISYRLEFILIKIYQALDSHNIAESGLGRLISNILKEEIIYREKTNFVNLDHEENKSVHETYYYRMSLLKKYVLEVLYLQSEIIKKEKVYRNMVAATGAALAASWAVFTDIQRINISNNTKDATIRLLLIFLIGIMAYVFKDRIKELSREYFNQKLKKYIPDFEKKMFYDYFDAEGQLKKTLIGISQEYMRYLPKSVLPPEIIYIRNLGTRKDFDPERDEVIINYSKKVTFDSKSTKDSLTNINFIRDISRFDISDFLDKLGDPDKVLRYFDTEKGIVVIEAPKVYHINVVIKYRIHHDRYANKSTSDYEYERMRIILNKKGIVRIENVIPRGEIKYTEAE